MEKENMFDNFKWMQLDSLDTAMIFMPPGFHGIYGFSSKDLKDFDLPEFNYDFNCPDSGDYSYSYNYSWPKRRVEVYCDPKSPGGGIISTPEKEYHWQKDRNKELEWLEQNKHGNRKEIDKRIIVSPPDIIVPATPTEKRYIVESTKSPERILKQELLDDGLIHRGKDYIVELSSTDMYINGEKQPRDVFKKYKKIYEGVNGHPIEVPVKMIF